MPNRHSGNNYLGIGFSVWVFRLLLCKSETAKELEAGHSFPPNCLRAVLAVCIFRLVASSFVRHFLVLREQADALYSGVVGQIDHTGYILERHIRVAADKGDLLNARQVNAGKAFF